MARASQALQRQSRVAVVKETTALTLENATSSDFVRHSGAVISIPRPTTYAEDADKTEVAEEITEGVLEASFQYPSSPLRPSGTVGGDSEADTLLECAIGTVASVASTTVNDAAATTTDVDLAAVTGLQAGDLLFFAGPGAFAVIESISGTTVTLGTPLPSAPADGTAVYVGKQFRPASDLPTVSIWQDLEHSQLAAAGHVLNELGIEFPANGRVMLSAASEGSGLRSTAHAATLGAAVLLGASSFTLSEGEDYSFDVSGGAVRVIVDEGAAGEEVVTVTAYDSDTRTATISGTFASAHDAGAEVAPYQVAPTHVGNHLASIAGALVLEVGASRVVLPVREASMSLNNGYVWDADALTGHRNNYYRQGANPREVSYSVTARFTRDVMRLVTAAGGIVTGAFVGWAHTKVDGSPSTPAVAVGSRKVHWQVPEIQSGTGDQVTLTITGRALAPAAGSADEFRVAIV